MDVNLWPITAVKPYDRNPRKIKKSSVEKVAASIREFGWQQPIVVDPDGVIIVGHTRLQAALKLKLKQVPVLVADNLSPEKIAAYRIADNRTGEDSGWDEELLADELRELEGKLELDITGFDKDELDALLKMDDGQGGEDEDKEQKAKSHTIQYNIIFDSDEQQDDWYKFLKILKNKVPEAETVGGRLHIFLRKINYGQI